MTQYLNQHGYIQWTSYQPGSRFWPFQWIEAAGYSRCRCCSSPPPSGWSAAAPPEYPATAAVPAMRRPVIDDVVSGYLAVIGVDGGTAAIRRFAGGWKRPLRAIHLDQAHHEILAKAIRKETSLT